MFTGIAHLYFPIIMPLRICFGIENDDYYNIDLALELVFLADMFVSCITGIFVGGEIIRDRTLIFHQYLRYVYSIRGILCASCSIACLFVK